MFHCSIPFAINKLLRKHHAMEEKAAKISCSYDQEEEINGRGTAPHSNEFYISQSGLITNSLDSFKIQFI